MIHTVRVAVIATMVIGAMYVCVVVAFNTLDRHRLFAQVDDGLSQRLRQAARDPASAAAIDNSDNVHDDDEPPIFFWRVSSSGRVVALTSGAPLLPRTDLANASPSVATLGLVTYRLNSAPIGGARIIAGQSLGNADRVLSDLVAQELLAGPALLIAVFLGTLLIGLKAAGPVEAARRRQLEFTADASHELRTPLSVIEAEVSLALNATRSANDYRETLVRVSREGSRLRDILEDLLWLSRFDSEPPPPGDQPVDVSVIAAACADRFEPVATRAGITLAMVQQVPGDVLINAPPEWIDRLIGVLVDNACRYAGRNGEVRINVGAQGNRVTLAVEDNGPGIAPEERASLFDRFHRATDEGNGAGLGLAIGDAVVRATGGEWRVGRSPLGGARMEVDWHRSPSPKDIGGRSESRGPVATQPLDRAEESPAPPLTTHRH